MDDFSFPDPAAAGSSGDSVSLDPGKTLFEQKTRELWQSRVLTCDGDSIGRVVRQIVEPQSFMIRYLVIYSETQDRHLIVPSNTVSDIDSGNVYCKFSTDKALQLPVFKYTLDREYEERVYRILETEPHWVEEAEVFS